MKVSRLLKKMAWTDEKISEINREAKNQINILNKMDDDTVPEKAKLIFLLDNLLVLTELKSRQNRIHRISNQKYNQNKQKNRIDDIIKKLSKKPGTRKFSLNDWYNAMEKEGIRMNTAALYKRVRPLMKRKRAAYSTKKEEQKMIYNTIKQIRRTNPQSKMFNLQEWNDALRKMGIDKGITTIYSYVRPFMGNDDSTEYSSDD